MSPNGWLQPYDNDELGRNIHYMKNIHSSPHISKDQHKGLYRYYDKKIKEIRATVPKNYVNNNQYPRHLERQQSRISNSKSSPIRTPNGQGGTRKSKLYKTKYRSHIRTHSRVRTVKSKSKSKSKRRQKK
jgi:hypothetical protein